VSYKPDRWGSKDPDKLTKGLKGEIDVDLAALNDWFLYCKMKYPSFFRGWTIEQFKTWNELRIAALEAPHPHKDYDARLAEIEGNCAKRIEV